MSSSSSSSGQSEEETEAPRAGGSGPSPAALAGAVELAQVCSFCTTFRQPLRLPAFTRTELEAALVEASTDGQSHVELLAELHFKLSREQHTTKMAKMLQDWEKAMTRKVADNWRLEFSANPMDGVAYRDLTVFDRAKILDALCHWKLESCAEIHKHISVMQKENNTEAIERLRGGAIGTDDNGVSYWHFDDGCWVYAEDKPQWQLEERKPSYIVEFASAKRIRLSINFDPDYSAATQVAEKASTREKKSASRKPKNEVQHAEDSVAEPSKYEKQELPRRDKLKNDGASLFAGSVPTKNVVVSVAKPVKSEKVEGAEIQKSETASVLRASTEVVDVKMDAATAVKSEVAPPVVPKSATMRMMDISMLCASTSPSSDEGATRTVEIPPQTPSHPANGRIGPQSDLHSRMETKKMEETVDTTRVKTEASAAEVPPATVIGTAPAPSTSVSTVDQDLTDAVASSKVVQPEKNFYTLEKDASAADERSSEMESSVTADKQHETNHEHASVVVVVGAKKKRTIIDDDSSESDSGKAASQAVDGPGDANELVSSPPPKKKRKSSTEGASDVNPAKTKKSMDAATNANESTHSNGMVSPRSVPAPKPAPKDMELTTQCTSKDETKGDSKIKDDSVPETNADAKSDAEAPTKTAEPPAAPETFDITCESCKKSYDMRYLDPPLVEHPAGEWRCFECLVNDARGWPRRRPRSRPSSRTNPREEEPKSRRGSSSTRPRSASSSSKKKRSSSKSGKSSSRTSSSKTKSTNTSASKRKSTSSKSSSSSKKASSSSSSKKHKKHKSSSSSHHHSSHHHHRRRHHNHHEQFAKLVDAFHERSDQRTMVEQARLTGEIQTPYVDGPQGWRVVSSTLDDLRTLIQTLSGGSLEQERLKGRLIVILKSQEKLEEQRLKQQEMAWNILARRQSSRIAMGKIRTQSSIQSEDEDGNSDEVLQTRRTRRSRPETSNGHDSKQQLAIDRERRARRRHHRIDSDDDMDSPDDVEEEELRTGVPRPGEWIDWPLLKGNTRCLSTVCLAMVDRLLKEETSELFARPVHPELDGCPTYLTVIKHPMDLGTIRTRAESSFYQKWEVFKKDVNRVWQNCRAFNAADTMVVQFGNSLEQLFRAMCTAAEKKGVRQMRNAGGDEGDDRAESDSVGDDDVVMSSSNESKAESRSSVNKAWTESSASESSESSDGNSSGDDSDSDALARKRRSARRTKSRPSTRTRQTRSSQVSPAKPRAAPTTRPAKKHLASDSSSEEETSSSEEDDDDPVPPPSKTRRSLEKAHSRATEAAAAPDADSDDVEASPLSLPPPPPPPPTEPQSRASSSKPRPNRLRISDSSSSEESSEDDDDDADGDSSSSSDSDTSDSDARPSRSSLAKKRSPAPRIPATRSPRVASSAPPPSASVQDDPIPPPPPPPATSPVSAKSQAMSSPAAKARRSSASTGAGSGRGRKTKTKTLAAEGPAAGYAHSPSLLHSYLSPSSSSSSYFSSSADSESSDADDSD